MGMGDNNEIQSRTNRMDDAFCARMRAAIEAGLESAPIGVISTPGTKNPKLAARYAAFSLSLPTTRTVEDQATCFTICNLESHL